MKMKSITSAALGALCMAVLFSGAAFGAHKSTPVEVLDEVFFDGRKLVYSYTIESRCAESKHDPDVELFVEKTPKKITAIYVDITDVSPEDTCGGKPDDVTVASEKNIGGLLRDELDALEDEGYEIPAGLTVELPPVRPRPSGVSKIGKGRDDVTLPSRGTGGASAPAQPKPTPPPAPTMVDVVEVNYTPAWRCLLRKNDGARDDGFEGHGSTVEEARNGAATACLSTNHPRCFDFSVDPAHTTCDLSFAENAKVVQYMSNELPAGTKTESWTCLLKKNDGSRKDGFSGAAATEAEARAQAAGGCGRTNHPQCEAFSLDSAHTSCAPRMRYEKPKPQTFWTCTLWKKDGSRKDGFAGTGPTEAEARRATQPGCYATNNPQCGAWSLDPAHTQCDVKLVYPE